MNTQEPEEIKEEIKIDYNLLLKDNVVDEFFLNSLRPPRKLNVSQWADENRILSRKASAEHGKWRTSRTPYLERPMDCLSEDHPANEIVVMKGAQVGFSEAGFNWIGYIIDHAPGPVMMVMPTVDTAKRNVRMRIEPMIEETPALKNKVLGSDKKKDKDNTTMMKSFPGGVFIASGGNSAASLRSVPIKYLMLDEEDAMPNDLDGEGSAIELAKARTRTFGSKKKVFRISTPTYEDTSTIATAYNNSTREKYHVPCPFCDHHQEIVWERIVWENDDPETVHFACEECGELIPEHFKTKMLKEGKWVAENPDAEILGFHISSLYSPLGWYSWKQAVSEFLDAKGNTDKMKTFYNTVLGRTWKERGDAPDWKKLFLQREQYTIGKIPTSNAVFLTMAVDVQKDRLEAEVVAWGEEKENWSITYEVILGDTSKEETWNKLDYFVQKQYEIEGTEQTMPVKLTVIDSGYNTQHVYNFCRKYPRSRVLPVKGSSKATVPVQIPKAVDVRTSGKVKRLGMKVWTVGIDMLKTEIYSILNQPMPLPDEEKPKGYYHFPEYDEEYFKMLTSEQLVKKKNNRGYYIYEWVKIRNRNEALDLKVYNRAASIILGIDRMMKSEFKTAKKPDDVAKTQKITQNNSQASKQKPKKKKRTSDFW